MQGVFAENMTDTIEHKGVIVRLDGSVASVRIEQLSACAGCHVKSVCTVSDKADKIVEATVHSGSYRVGDSVTIVGQKSIGIQAVLLAYVLPFVLIIVTMLIMSCFIDNELIVGSCGLAVLIPYFVVLKMMDGKLQSRFRFYVVD